MAVGDEGQLPEYAQAGFGNTDGNAGENPANVRSPGTAGEIPANASIAGKSRCEPG